MLAATTASPPTLAQPWVTPDNDVV
jgi:hypothetical protein